MTALSLRVTPARPMRHPRAASAMVQRVNAATRRVRVTKMPAAIGSRRHARPTMHSRCSKHPAVQRRSIANPARATTKARITSRGSHGQPRRLSARNRVRKARRAIGQLRPVARATRRAKLAKASPAIAVNPAIANQRRDNMRRPRGRNREAVIMIGVSRAASHAQKVGPSRWSRRAVARLMSSRRRSRLD